MIRQCSVTLCVRVRAFVCVYSCTPRHTQCCSRGHAARNLHYILLILHTYTCTYTHIHTCTMRIPQSILMEYVPSPKVYDVCFYKRTINSIIIITCAHARAHTYTHTCWHMHTSTRGHTHIYTPFLSHARASVCVCAHTHTHTHSHKPTYYILTYTWSRNVVCSV